MFKMSIRYKFLLPTVVLIIIGMGTSSIISFIKSKNSLSTALLANIEQQTESTVTILQSWVKDRGLDLKSWSSEEVYIKATKSSIIGKAARVNASKKMAHLKADYGYYEDLLLATKDGVVIASSNNAATGKINIIDRDYFKAAIGGDNFISDITISRASSKPVFIIATPVMEKGEVKGVLAGLVSLTSVTHKFIDPIKVGEHGYGYVINKDGLMIAHPDPAKIMKENLSEYDFGQQILAEKNGLMQYDFEGVSKEVAFQTVEETGWIVAVNVPESEILAPVKSLTKISLLVLVSVVVIAVVVIYLITSSVVRPITRVVDGLRDAAEGDGDLTKRLEVKGTDEVAELAKWFNVFIEKIQVIIADVAQNANNLNKSSKELGSISEQLSSSAEQTASRASNVSAASEETSTTISSVAGVMEETAGNLNIVAAGAEEMTATITEIANTTGKGRQIAEDAVGQTNHATRQIEELGQAAVQIGKVVETITEISEQVNLLALNATIEAARAGEAGKGFAVVANEIKELAKQTAEASGEIKQQIEGIQVATEGSVTEINSIAQIVGQVNDLVSTIASAVEEQSVTTQEIAGNVAKASEGVGEVNSAVAESANAANSITAEIADVTVAADDMTNASAKVNTSSTALSEYAEELSTMVKQFRV